MKRTVPVLTALTVFIALILCSGGAADGARRGLAVCAATLAPSLLPFFTLANLLSALGLSQLLAKTAGPFMAKLFGVSGVGAEAFFIGLSGGYPLGASVTANLRREGRISRSEGERLLAFCNNSGPAFIVGAAGAVFGSVKAGLLLYAVHIASAVCVGIVMRLTSGSKAPEPAVGPIVEHAAVSFAEAFTGAMSKAIASTVAVCGFVTFFNALLGMLGGLSFLPLLWRIFATGILELGSGIGAMVGLSPTPVNLALAAFLLGWGGLSVHCQTLGAVAQTDIRCARHLAGRALDGVLSAVLAYLLGLSVF